MLDDVLKLGTRVLLAVPCLVTGATKLTDPSGVARMLGVLSLPSPESFGWLVGLCEMAGGAALVAGGFLLLATTEARTFLLASFRKPEKPLARA